MKTLIYLWLCLSMVMFSKAQVVFCPSGAQWNYNFSTYTYSVNGYGFENEQIKYLRDSILNTDTCKVISTTRHYVSCNYNLNLKLSLLKQHGDTIFYRNYYTQNTWQVLYNFAAQKGQSWTNNYVSTAFTIITNTVTVDSVNTVTMNGYLLKRQLVNIKTIYPYSIVTNTTIFTERIGSDQYLFYNLNDSPYYPRDEFEKLLCYKDDTFGLKTFAFKSCNYSNPLGLRESIFENEFEIFPNPFSDCINVQSKNQIYQLHLSIKNLAGKELIRSEEPFSDKILLNLESIEPGLYFVELYSEGRLIATQKIIKK